jgi:type IV secretory pathway VirB2 component (pilin)
VLSDETEEISSVQGKMPPGIAGICLLMVLLTMANVVAALHGAFGTGAAKAGILALCTLLAAGILGLLRLRKWGWALVTAGCLLFAASDFFIFSKTHLASLLVRGLFMLVFFLYLVRQETRERLG